MRGLSYHCPCHSTLDMIALSTSRRELSESPSRSFRPFPMKRWPRPRLASGCGPFIHDDEDVAAGAVSFRYRDGSQKNGVPVAEAIAEIAAARDARVQV